MNSHQQTSYSTRRNNYGSHEKSGDDYRNLSKDLQQHQYHHKSQQYSSDDNLEYFIKFPSSNIKRNDENIFETFSGNESDFIFVYNDTNIPVVLLLGWAGCLDRYLLKYSKIYEERGLITVRYTAPIDTLFWKRSGLKDIGEKILKLIFDMNFDSHPIIFHVFSNGGAFLYQHISHKIMETNYNQIRPIHVRGVIFDSAPGERRIMGLYRAVTAIYGRDNRKCNFLQSWFVTLSLTVMWLFEDIYTSFKCIFNSKQQTISNPFQDLKNDCTNWPQLFLYSKGDIVIPYKDIEDFASYREKRGIDVTKVCFEDAEHVKIFTKYPQQYIHCICKFINNCLTTSKFD